MIFITGGVRSGKSAFAEQLCETFQRSNNIYIATAQAIDDEMRNRIQLHQEDRNEKALQWQTIEMNVDFPEGFTPSVPSTILFECVTTWLSNVQYAAENDETPHVFVEHAIERFQQQLVRLDNNHTVIIVSNELLDDVASIYEEANAYRAHLGKLHQWLVAQSEHVYEIEYKMIKKWK